LLKLQWFQCHWPRWGPSFTSTVCPEESHVSLTRWWETSSSWGRANECSTASLSGAMWGTCHCAHHRACHGCQWGAHCHAILQGNNVL